MKKNDFEIEKGPKKIKAQFLSPYELSFENALQDEEFCMEVSTGPNCLRR